MTKETLRNAEASARRCRNIRMTVAWIFRRNVARAACDIIRIELEYAAEVGRLCLARVG